MPNGPLNQTIGYGPATVWNPNVAAQNFGVLLQKQKQQDEEDANAIAAELSKVRSDGLRNDADRQYFLNRYSEIKKNATSGLGERNTIKRALNKAQTRDDLLALQQYVQRSKAQGANEAAFGRQYMQNPTPWSDDAINNYRKSIAAPLDSPDVIKDFTTQQRVSDHGKVDSGLSKLDHDALNRSQWSNEVQEGSPYIEGGKKRYVVSKNREVGADQILAQAAHMYDIDRNVRHSIDERYANIKGDTPEDTKMLRLRQNAIDRGALSMADNGQLITKISQKNSKVKDYYTDPYYAHFNFREANSPNALQTPSQTLISGDPSRNIPGMQQGGVGTGEKFINLAPAYQYGGKKPSIGIDDNTGEHIFNFPAQVVPDKSAVAKNKKLREDYAASPETKGGILGFGAKKVPFEQSETAKGLLPELSVKKPEQTYRVNPASPDYLSKIAEIAKEQNINLSQLNQIEGKKSNRGQIDQAVHNQGVHPSVKKSQPSKNDPLGLGI